MPELRWILIVFGSALLIGIYVWGRRGAKDKTADDAMLRIQPAEDFEPRENIEPSVDVPEETPSYAESVVPEAESFEDEEPIVAPVRATHDESREPTIEVLRTREVRGARIEPTFGDESQTAELPVNDVEEREPAAPAAQASTATDAPTLGMSSAPPPRRIERRKIIALRLAAAPQRLPGAQLQAAFESESLQHGKYEVFHRLDEQGAAIFSVASMVEPGTFNLDKMSSENYTGITLFTQLPGPVAGMLAFNELVACSRRLHAALGGTLQDERGVPLTVHRIERLRQEIREFEHRPAVESAHRASPTYSS